KSLRLVGIKKKHAVENDNVRGQSSRNESMNVEDDRDDGSNSDDGSTSDDDSDSQDSDFLIDPYNMIDDVDVDMAEFRSNIDANVEWVGSKAIVTIEEEEFEEEGVNHDELDSGSDSKYEGERKKALNVTPEKFSNFK
nr:transposase, mutator type [Tanacetum cinerariifolium]